MTLDLLQRLVLIVTTRHEVVISEENALEKVIIHEMERRYRVQIPAEHTEQVEFASLDGVEAWVAATMGQTRSVLRQGKEEATVEAVSDQGVSLAHLLNQWNIIINLIELGG